MKRRPSVFAVTSTAFGALVMLGGGQAVAGAAAPAKLSYNDHIQPILADNCYSCHGVDPGSRKAELRLGRLEHATAKR